MLRAPSALFIAAMSIASGPAFAEEPSDAGTTQAVVFFAKSCMAFAGQTDALRTWVKQNNLSALPPETGAKLLESHSGQAFSFAGPAGNIMLASNDDGGCTIFAQHVIGTLLQARFEAIITGAKFDFKITSDHDDPRNMAVHHRGYDISGKRRGWRVVISSVPPGDQAQAFDAILSAYNLPPLPQSRE
jgi:hypothetical protein